MIQWIITALTIVFNSRIGSFIASALLWAGISYGTSALIVQPALDTLFSYVDNISTLGGVASSVWAWVGVLKFDIAVTMVASAVVAKQAAQAAKIHLFKARS